MDNTYTAIVLATILFFCAYYWIWLRNEVNGAVGILERDMRLQWANIGILLGAAFIVKAIFAVNYEGHGADMNCFKSWSNMVYDNGISQFYYSDAFTGCPPGYMLVLWAVAAIRHLFDMETGASAGIFLIKLFPILCDLGAGLLIYLLAKKRFSENVSLMLTLMYVLNPVIVLNSSVWGQVDGVFTLAVIATCYLCMEEKRIPAYFVFCIGVLLKPQTLIFAPVLIFTIVEQLFLKDFNVRKLVRDLVGGLAAIGVMFLLAAPFGLEKVIAQYIDTLGAHDYCSVNAYNIWVILGKNWASQNDKFLFLECRTWGTIAIFVAVGLSAWIFFRAKEEKSKYFLSMAALVTVMFLFSMRVDERYLFPVIALVLIGFILKPTWQLFLTFTGFTVVQFAKVAHVYYYYVEHETMGPEGYIMGATAVACIFMFGYLIYSIFRKSEVVYEPNVIKGKGRKKRQVQGNRAAKRRAGFHFEILPSKRMPGLERKDFIILFSIMAVYSCFALYDLGDRYAPETGWESEQNGNQIVLDLGGEKEISKLYAYPGSYEDRKFTVETSSDGVNYQNIGTVNVGSVFRWNEVKFEKQESESEARSFTASGSFVRLTLAGDKVTLKELVFKGADGEAFTPQNAADYPELFDEQDKFDPELGFRSGTYFDEIYHARTAYEMIHEYYCYENTHPPLGKIFISLGIRVFGMVPFGWRIVGTLFGIGMIPFLYLFGKRLFGETWIAGVVTVLFSFDFMHFVQTRIATIDVYGTFFIIAMFYFMLRYAQTSFYDTEFKKTLIPLGLSGLMMGLGCASKWTAIYAGAGLAVFFFAVMFRRYMEYRVAMRNPEGETAGISHRHILEVFQKNLIYTLAWCVLFFIVIPGIIYLLSYIPFRDGTPDGVWDQMLRNQSTMFNYHSKLTATHAYSSTWSEWPPMIRPVFYYTNTVAGELREGISAFGNPLVWWAGIFAFVYMIYRVLRKYDRVALFLCFAYLVQYLPWTLISRCTFAYHYFPSVPFVALMVGYSLYCFIGGDKKKRWYAYLYCGAEVALFGLFYPVLAGQPVAMEYITNGLKWLSGWVLAL